MARANIRSPRPKPLTSLVPRRVRLRELRFAAGCVILGLRLFILPHTIVGAGLVLWLGVVLAWAAAGVETTGRVVAEAAGARSSARTRPASTRAVAWRNGTTGETSTWVPPGLGVAYAHAGVERRVRWARDDLEQLAHREGAVAVAEGLPVRVRHLGIGPWRYAAAMGPGEPVWGRLAFTAAFAVGWNAILGFFVYWLWVKPWRSKRLYRWGDGDGGHDRREAPRRGGGAALGQLRVHGGGQASAWRAARDGRRVGGSNGGRAGDHPALAGQARPEGGVRVGLVRRGVREEAQRTPRQSGVQRSTSNE